MKGETMKHLIHSLAQFGKRLNEGYDQYFQNHNTVHWLFFGLGLTLVIRALFTRDIYDLITSLVKTVMCCPLKPFVGVPGLTRYLTIGILTSLQLIRAMALS